MFSFVGLSNEAFKNSIASTSTYQDDNAYKYVDLSNNTSSDITTSVVDEFQNNNNIIDNDSDGDGDVDVSGGI